MKVLSNDDIISEEASQDWQSWKLTPLDGQEGYFSPVQLLALAQQRRRERDALRARAEEEQAAAQEQSVAEASEVLSDEENQDPDQQALSDEVEQQEVAHYPTAAELENIHQQAWDTGHEAGLEVGRAAGYQEGLQTGREEALLQVREEQKARFAEAWQPLQHMAESFHKEFNRLEQGLSAELLQLTLSLAQQVVLAQIQVDSQALVPVLQAALADLPSVLAQAKLRVNPADLAAAREFLSTETPETQWQWIEDPGIERGGCVIDATALRLDLTVASRLAALGQALQGNRDEPANPA